MASRRDTTVNSLGRISTFNPASFAVFAVTGPIQAMQVLFIFGKSDSPVKVRKFLTVDDEVKVSTSIFSDCNLFARASDLLFGKTVW